MKSCSDCIHSGLLVQPDKTVHKVCRKRPPTAAIFQVHKPSGVQIANATLWPTITENDWCSEHQSRLMS